MVLQEADGKERQLAKHIQQAQQRVHEALLDNLNSRAALEVLLDLVKDTNKYLKDRQGNSQGQFRPTRVKPVRRSRSVAAHNIHTFPFAAWQFAVPLQQLFEYLLQPV